MTTVNITSTPPLLTGLTATAVIRGVDLKWDDLLDDSYNSASIYRSDTDVLSNSVKIGTAKDATQYLDNTVNSNQTYYYWVRAVNIYGFENGDYEPAGPTGVSVTTSQAGTLDIVDRSVTDYTSNSSEAQALYTASGDFEADIYKLTLDYTTPAANVLDYLIEFDMSIYLATPLNSIDPANSGTITSTFINFRIDNITDNTNVIQVSQNFWETEYNNPGYTINNNKAGFIYWRHIMETPLALKLYRMTMDVTWLVTGETSSPATASLSAESRTMAIKPYKK